MEWLEPFDSNIDDYTPNELATMIKEKQQVLKNFLENNNEHINEVLLPL